MTRGSATVNAASILDQARQSSDLIDPNLVIASAEVERECLRIFVSTLAGTVTGLVGCTAAAVSIAVSLTAVVRGVFMQAILGLMATDHAASASAEQSVMAGTVSCDPTNDSTLYPAAGRRSSH
jgi:hypothetical protein